MHNRIMLIGVFNAGKRAIAIEWGFSGGLGSSAITDKAGVIGSTLADHLLACDPSVEVVGVDRFTPTP
jgi:hypothetical protein